ncbi:MAG TPA: hypothetical protein VFJ98_08115 [Mycobacteriales bacterium]|nr:hypothetical protein [Mycobacteriales bacterium]
MSRRPLARAGIVASLACASLAVALPAWAHNAGHFTLPSGACAAVGSFKDAPLVGADRHTLDLVPATPTVPFDEYGVSFVGFQDVTGGSAPILPGPCPQP